MGKGILQQVLDKIEIVGNKLPQPVTIFVILSGVVLVLSFIFSSLGVSVEHPSPDITEPVKAINLLNSEGIQKIMTSMVDVFINFPPLGLVLTVMLGIGIAERSGLISISLQYFVSKSKKSLITFSIVVFGMISSVAGDVGYVVLIPLSAFIFRTIGRHPLAGLAAAFAGVSGGFGANIVPTGNDPLMAAFTESAANILDPGYTVNPLSNYFFLAVSVPVVGLVGTWVTEKIIVPRLGTYQSDEQEGYSPKKFTSYEKKGLKWALVVTLLILAVVAIGTIFKGGPFRGEDGSLQPFYDSIVPLMFIIFFVGGLVFGIVSKTVKSDKDVANILNESMGTMGSLIVLAFFAAHLVQFFIWSNLGTILAISGADALQRIGFVGMPLLVAALLFSAFINLIIGSASAKYAILAPIFVPLMMLMGYSPETTQLAYRIGDSFTNIITPLLPYFPLIIVFAQKYVKNIGIGTLISMMLPYAFVFMVVRIIKFVIWIWLEIPLGIEGPIFYSL